mgnify:CR=1 FL=1
MAGQKAKNLLFLFICALIIFAMAGGILLLLYDAPPQVTPLGGEPDPSVVTTEPSNTEATTQAPTAAPTEAPTVAAVNGKVLLPVPTMCQLPEYPTGCESVSTVMALRYAGEDITVDDFIDNYLVCSNDFKTVDGVQYGPDPNEVFLGSPRDDGSLGCMAPVIENALIKRFGSSERVVNATGTEMSELCSRYIDHGKPVIVWATLGMVASAPGRSWILPDGTQYTWKRHEHCLLLVGYDDVKYYFNDPYSGKTRSCNRDIAEKRYAEYDKQAIVIL